MKTLETKPCAAVYSVFQDTERREADGLPPIVPFDTIAFEGECIVYVERIVFGAVMIRGIIFRPFCFVQRGANCSKLRTNQ